jgi:hypothetical protein
MLVSGETIVVPMGGSRVYPSFIEITDRAKRGPDVRWSGGMMPTKFLIHIPSFTRRKDIYERPISFPS